METITIGTAGIASLLGYGVVFFGLVLLMFVVMLLGKIMVRRARTVPQAAPVSGGGASAPSAPPAPAPGSAGKVKLYDVSDRDAALVMAIVANRIGRPINELRFRSIREVEKS